MKPSNGLLKNNCAAGLIMACTVLFSGCSLASKSQLNRKAPIAQSVDYNYFSSYQVVRGDVYKTVVESLSYNKSGGSALCFNKSNAKIVKAYYEVGDRVKKGDLLLECDSDEIGKKVESLEEDAKKYQDEITYYSSMKEIEEKRKLIDASYGRRYDSSKYDEYVSALDISTKQLNITNMQLEEAREELEGCKIYADMDGVVAFIAHTSERTRLRSSDTAITITDQQSFFTCSTKNIHLFEIGGIYDMVYFFAPNIKNGQLESEIEKETTRVKCISMEPVRENSETYELKFILVEDKGVDFSGDLSAKITIVTESAENVLYVPKTAVISSDTDSIVYVQNDKGERMIKSVETGVSNTDIIEIKSGLEQGDTVLTNNKNQQNSQKSNNKNKK